MRHINKLLTFGLAAFAIMGFSGCSDDDFGGNALLRDSYNSDTQLVLELALPVQPAETRASMNLSGDEGKVNDLRIIAFGKGNGASDVINRPLPVSDLASQTNDKGMTVFEVKGFSGGQYQIYIIANMGDAVSNITDETKLKGIINDYTDKLPTPGNLPMVYDSGASLINVPSQGEKPEVLETSLKIAAVKVKYNLIFDKKDAAAVFGENGLKIKGITVTNAAAESYLIENTAPAKTMAERTVTTVPTYHNSYVNTPANAGVDNKDVITFTESAVNAPASYAGTWVASGTLYLPERYAKSGDKKTLMNIEAVATDKNGAEGSVRCSYSINLAGYQGHEDELSMPRDTYYEVIGRVKTLGTAKLDSYIVVKKWSQQTIQAVFSGTYLQLDKTRGSVASLTDDFIRYTSDAKSVPHFECDTKINGKETVKAIIDQGTIKLIVNPEISVDELPNNHGKGVATCWIVSGNIRKQVLVNYDIEPFFKIDAKPKSIEWTNGTSDPEKQSLVKEYEYSTNLGGLLITASGDKSKVLIGGSSNLKSYEVLVRNSRLVISCDNPQAAIGILKVTATSNPQTSTLHEFDAYPAKALTQTKYETWKVAESVTVKPPLGGYRIYFRAVNDWHTFDGGDGCISGQWLGGNDPMGSSYPTEYYGTADANNNWIDYWYCANNDGNSAWNNGPGNYNNGKYYPHEDSHRIYIWTQTGERLDVDANPPVWRFTSEYNNAPKMKQDYANAGWYYHDLSADAFQVATSGGASGNKKPEPGTTLMIFHNQTNAGTHGFTAHRVPGHLEPGIPLFDFEDREGWVLFDPTTDGLYRTFDEKPIIEDVVYTIYSDTKPTGWWRKYGIATKQPSGTGFPQYTIYSNNTASVTTETINGKTYYKYQIRLKAPRGYYAKAININFGGTTGGGTTTGQRVWYYSKNGWENPRVYVYSGDQKNAEWGSTPSMTKDRTEGGGTYYYYDIPSNLSNGQVIFQNSDRSQQNPAQNQAGRSLGGKSMVYYADSGSWMEYPGSSSSSSSTSSSYSAKLFGGRSFAGNTGYYNNTTKTWTVGKPQ